ncbi:hypothetical protein [Hyphomicrobium sp. 99]|uniref:AbiTii domain-containing protein n=1 Tax=Hyphomicrobium sp. 99 TaxID=1163419 RepID=UPI0012DFFED1|nr:hypothetical protein [Hyphomicrobium sp. 99]
MTKESSVLRLQNLALDPNASVSDLLRLAKAIAVKLGVIEAARWIDDELTGYMDKPEVPTYRQLPGEWKGYSPYMGWQPIHFEDIEQQQRYSIARLGESISALEESYKNKDTSKAMAFAGGHGVRSDLVKEFGLHDARLFISPTAAWAIIDRVRTIILDWTLELEEAGVLGEGLKFSSIEQREAGPVTHQYFIQNVGVMGDVSGGTVSNQQQASITIDAAKLADAISKGREHLAQLPAHTAADLEPVLDALEYEGAAASPSTIRELLKSVQTILEGAAGNVVAEGLKAIFLGLIS